MPTYVYNGVTYPPDKYAEYLAAVALDNAAYPAPTDTVKVVRPSNGNVSYVPVSGIGGQQRQAVAFDPVSVSDPEIGVITTLTFAEPVFVVEIANNSGVDLRTEFGAVVTPQSPHIVEDGAAIEWTFGEGVATVAILCPLPAPINGSEAKNIAVTGKR